MAIQHTRRQWIFLDKVGHFLPNVITMCAVCCGSMGASTAGSCYRPGALWGLCVHPPVWHFLQGLCQLSPTELGSIFGQYSQAQNVTLGNGAVWDWELDLMILVDSFQLSLLCDSVYCSPQPMPFVFPNLCSQIIKNKLLFLIPNTHLESAY